MEEMSFMSDWADDEREATKNGIVGFYFTNDSMLCRVYEVTDNCETELINLLEDFEKYQKRLPTRIYLPNEVIDKLDLIEAVEKNMMFYCVGENLTLKYLAITTLQKQFLTENTEI